MNLYLKNVVFYNTKVLNNKRVLDLIYDEMLFPGIILDNKIYYTQKHISIYFDINSSILNQYVDRNFLFLKKYGLTLLSEEKLEHFKSTYEESDSISEELIKKTKNLKLFPLRAFILIGLTLSESKINSKKFKLDHILKQIDQKNIGNSLFYNSGVVNIRQIEQEPKYRSHFVEALDNYVVPNTIKYRHFTFKIYQSIFNIDLKFVQIQNLQLKLNENAPDYREVFNLISIYENGYLNYLKKYIGDSNVKLRMMEATYLFTAFEDEKLFLYTELKGKINQLISKRTFAFKKINFVGYSLN